jgi:hypothetical protein
MHVASARRRSLGDIIGPSVLALGAVFTTTISSGFSA